MTLQITPLLQAVVTHQGSDLHLKAGVAPRVRISGTLVPLQCDPLGGDQLEALVRETMTAEVADGFAATNEADYALHVDGVGRFRVNAFRARGGVGCVLRSVGDEPRTLAELEMPEAVHRLALEHRGLVLVTGPTGSGKSTTLAAMIDAVNETRAAHILTVEDPIEVVHRDKRASISQRELGTDTASWPVALRAAMRQDPDVILIGEMRDADTVRAAVSAAATGHLVLSTLHTTDARETVSRVVDFFPPYEQKQVRLALAASLRGIVCQRLVRRADGSGRVAALEIAVNTPRLAEAIATPDLTETIPALVAEGGYSGMQTFDDHLVRLVLDGTVTIRDAKATSSNPHDFSVLLKRAGVDPTLVDQT
ncbi:PilT/PilU family type 4a pilus ATPase [Nocardioides sp. YIM 152315]|uniref:type IV pilus twitching motility protein PilT n=1 Tax=Nocardioides sp. YIM 152315 TaxID=3031760 RepID=UPI0023DA1BCD|nr:PilT/PilU family type 4a pilus ATPase [Nocardioides sp. YIM 152315]MDF1603490.1 PilT/PilU family type 4a pilus ATPase [Nocardioides sp. YIM 152315]